MGNEQRMPANASAGQGKVRGEPQARNAGGKARKLWAGLGRFLAAREQHHGGVYLPLVRIDGRD